MGGGAKGKESAYVPLDAGTSARSQRRCRSAPLGKSHMHTGGASAGSLELAGHALLCLSQWLGVQWVVGPEGCGDPCLALNTGLAHGGGAPLFRLIVLLFCCAGTRRLELASNQSPQRELDPSCDGTRGRTSPSPRGPHAILYPQLLNRHHDPGRAVARSLSASRLAGRSARSVIVIPCPEPTCADRAHGGPRPRA